MKRKNKPIRRTDAVQPLPLPADAGEIAFAHGVSRRVVVVDAAESPLFEQIIYIVRDDAASGGVTAADLVQQARDAVGCVPAPAPRPRQKSYTGLLSPVTFHDGSCIAKYSSFYGSQCIYIRK